jgi:hypothetical protein
MGRLLIFLPAFACVGGMGLCMWLMSRGHGAQGTDQQADASVKDPEVAELRAEVARLREEAQARHEQAV